MFPHVIRFTLAIFFLLGIMKLGVGLCSGFVFEFVCSRSIFFLLQYFVASTGSVLCFLNFSCLFIDQSSLLLKGGE